MKCKFKYLNLSEESEMEIQLYLAWISIVIFKWKFVTMKVLVLIGSITCRSMLNMCYYMQYYYCYALFDCFVVVWDLIDWCHFWLTLYFIRSNGGIMVRMLALSAVGRGFETQSYKYCYKTKGNFIMFIRSFLLLWNVIPNSVKYVRINNVK